MASESPLTRIVLCGGLPARKGVALRALKLEEISKVEGNSKLIDEALAIIAKQRHSRETGAV